MAALNKPDALIWYLGDYPVLHAARAEARKQFEQNRQLGVDTPLKIQHALETAHILKTNIVQGTKIETKDEGGEKVDRYCMFPLNTVVFGL